MGKVGRPSKYSPELVERICERLSEGESMRSICRDPAMPSRATIDSWIESNAEFQSRCARAREWQAEACDEDIAATIESVRVGVLDPQAGRVILAGQQWRASKLAPKRYGDKMLHTGPDGASPVAVNVNVSFGA